jgi:hypothetical protein
VNTKKVVVEEAIFHKNDIIGTESAPSVSSYRSSATGKSKISRSTSSRQAAVSHKNSRSNEEFDKTGKIIELDDDSDNDYNSSLLGSTGEFEMLQKMVNYFLFFYVLYI